ELSESAMRCESAAPQNEKRSCPSGAHWVEGGARGASPCAKSTRWMSGASVQASIHFMRPPQSGQSVTSTRNTFFRSQAQGFLFGLMGSSPKRCVCSASPRAAAECCASLRGSFFGTTSERPVPPELHSQNHENPCTRPIQ